MKVSIQGLVFILFIVFSSFAMCNTNGDKKMMQEDSSEDKEYIEKQAAFDRLRSKADSAKAYCKAKGFSNKYCILIDFSIHSGKNRFFVWDFEKDTIKYSGLCCHGYGRGSTTKTPVFSNVEGSYCSSLGKYKIGARAYSQWGINVHYKMHGLEKTNNNAFKRWVVLHSHTPVMNHEIYPDHLPLGWSQGCPVISDEMMRKVDGLLEKSDRSVLLWIYS